MAAPEPRHRTAVLLGSEHEDLGRVAHCDVGPHMVGALSRGRFRKGYPHVDPNEDALLIASVGPGHLMAVVDGHNGFDAAGATIASIGDAAGPLLDSESPSEAVRRTVATARDAVADAVASLEEPRSRSRASVTLVVVRGDRGFVISLGDSAAIRVRASRPRVLTAPTAFFGPDTTLDDVTVGSFSVRPGDYVMAMTDGVTDFLGRNWPRKVGALCAAGDPPGDVSEAMMKAAFDGGAGDNVAAAVLRMPAARGLNLG